MHMILRLRSVLLTISFHSDSASPLNGEAALLWDSNQEEFKRKVLARHVEPSELEE